MCICIQLAEIHTEFLDHLPCDPFDLEWPSRGHQWSLVPLTEVAVQTQWKEEEEVFHSIDQTVAVLLQRGIVHTGCVWRVGWRRVKVLPAPIQMTGCLAMVCIPPTATSTLAAPVCHFNSQQTEGPEWFESLDWCSIRMECIFSFPSFIPIPSRLLPKWSFY